MFSASKNSKLSPRVLSFSKMFPNNWDTFIKALKCRKRRHQLDVTLILASDGAIKWCNLILLGFVSVE